MSSGEEKIGLWLFDTRFTHENWSEDLHELLGVPLEHRTVSLLDVVPEITPFVFSVSHSSDTEGEIEFERSGENGQKSRFRFRLQIKRALDASPQQLFGALIRLPTISAIQSKIGPLHVRHKEMVQDPMIVVDRDFRMLEVNKAITKFSPKVALGQLVGETCYYGIFGHSEPCQDCPAARCFKVGETVKSVRFVPETQRWCEIQAYPLFDHISGEIIAVASHVRDVDDRHRASEALRKSESILSDLFNSIQDAVLILDRECNVLRHNEAFERLFPGIGTLVGHKCAFPAKSQDVCNGCPVVSLFSTGQSSVVVQYEPATEGQPERWLDRSSFPIVNRDTGEIDSALYFIKDVSEAMRSRETCISLKNSLEKAISDKNNVRRAAETRLTSVIEAIHANIAFTDPELQISYVNSAFKSFMACSIDELYGSDLRDWMTELEDLENVHALIDQVLDGKIEQFRTEVAFKHGTKEKRNGELYLSALKNDEGHIIQFLVVVVDLTERVRMFDELRAAKSSADSANEAKSMFLATMSHEIRTPLNGVIGLSELLSNMPLSQKQLEYVQLIQSSGKSLLFLINDILDFSKIEAGKLDIEREEYDIFSVVESVLGMIGSKAMEKKIALCASFAANVPNVLLGDSGRVRQIIINLVNNAVKFTDSGGICISVSLVPSQEKWNIRISVADSGVGIPESSRERLFKEFSQIDSGSTEKKQSGTGLGLSISLRLVQLMHGNIGIEDNPNGVGSVFWFELPLLAPAVCSSCYEIPELKVGKPATTGAYGAGAAAVHTDFGISPQFSAEQFTSRSCLIVDENATLLQSLSSQLLEWGAEAQTCTSRLEAMRLLKMASTSNKMFDVILVGKSLSDSSGKKLLTSIGQKASLKSLPIIFLTPITESCEFLARFEQDNAERVVQNISMPIYTKNLHETLLSAFFPNEYPPIKFEKKKKKPFSRNTSKRADKPEKTKSLPLSASCRVLVAEDNRINQIVVREMLLTAGIDCCVVENGRQAVDAFLRNECDLILMDCQMPEMDGYEAASSIRQKENEQGTRIPIIALTANATRDDEIRCLESGMDAYCSKPIDPGKLICIMRQMCPTLFS